MSSRNTKRRSRKTRGGAPGATRSQRREHRGEIQAARERSEQARSAQASRTLGTYGERPAGLFGPVPVSEIAILAGIVGMVVGYLTGGGAPLVVGAIVCGLGVIEVTAREHFSGYRSHATLLAAIPAVILEVALALLVGVPRQRVLLLLPVIPVFAGGLVIMRRAFRTARHTRVTRPPSA